MPTIHISDDVFADYLFYYEDAAEAKKQMKQAVEDKAPNPEP